MNVGTPATCTINGVTANSTWTASFSNGAGGASNNPRSASFTVQAGGGGAFAGCPAGSLTIDGQWGQSAIETAQFGDFTTQILSIRVSPPTGWSSSTAKTSSWAEYRDSPVSREAVFSTQPCDFSTTNALKTSLGIAARSVDVIGFAFKYKTGGGTTSSVSITPGQHYYINVRNLQQGQNSCTSGTCNMRGGLPAQ
jgi:hypothetical protein